MVEVYPMCRLTYAALGTCLFQTFCLKPSFVLRESGSGRQFPCMIQVICSGCKTDIFSCFAVKQCDMTNVHTEAVLWCFCKQHVICTLLQSLRTNTYLCKLVFSDRKNVINSPVAIHTERTFQWIVSLTGPWKQQLS